MKLKSKNNAIPGLSSVFVHSIIGNLRTTTKFTTTTSVDRESTGTRTSVSARKRKLKMQSVGRTTTALNVNTKLFVRDKVFFVMASSKTMQDLIFLSHMSNFIDDE